MVLMVRAAVWLGSVMLMTACSAGERDTLSTRKSPIIRGVVDDVRNDAVVMLVHQRTAQSGSRCSGTLIGRTVVATARHCVSDEPSPGVLGADYDPASLFVYAGVSPQITEAHVRRIVHDGAATLDDHDFALLVLDRPIGDSIASVRLAAPPTDGESVLAVGYGTTELDDAPSAPTHTRYRRDALTVLLVGPAAEYKIGGHELVVGESTCQGDSGGPLMNAQTGALIAVSARGGNGRPPTATEPWAPCIAPVYNLFTRIDGFAALIRATLADVGQTPQEEAPRIHAAGGGCDVGVLHGGEQLWIVVVSALAAIARRRRAVAIVALSLACKRVDEPEPSREPPRSNPSAKPAPEPAKIVVENGKLMLKGGFSAEPVGTPGPNVKVADERIGTGEIVTEGHTVKVRHSCRLEGGEVVDSSSEVAPLTFTLGKNAVVEGFDTGIPGMRVGGKRTLNIPPNRAYGVAGKPPHVPPNARLICDIELLSRVQ